MKQASSAEPAFEDKTFAAEVDQVRRTREATSEAADHGRMAFPKGSRHTLQALC